MRTALALSALLGALPMAHAQINPIEAGERQFFMDTLRKAHAGDQDSQLYVGRMYLMGRGVAFDAVQARRWLQPLAERGDARAQQEMSNSYAMGRLGKDRNMDQALFWLTKAAIQGSASAEEALAIWYEYGNGVPKDAALAMTWRRKAADHGNSRSQSRLGTFYEEGSHGVPQDFQQAMSWYLLAAKQGDESAMVKVATGYHKGLGVPKDPVAATMWGRKAAEAGNLDAMLAMAQRASKGDGMVPDLAEAWKWLDEAVRRANSRPEPHRMRGLFFLEGLGKPKDVEAGIRELTLAAEAGDGESMVDLANIYAGDQFGVKSAPKAFQWFLNAADRGDGSSIFVVAQMLAQGEGVPKDAGLAWALLGLWKSDEEGAVQQLRAQVRPQLSAAQLKEAEALTQTLTKGFEAEDKPGPIQKALLSRKRAS